MRSPSHLATPLSTELLRLSPDVPEDWGAGSPVATPPGPNRGKTGRSPAGRRGSGNGDEEGKAIGAGEAEVLRGRMMQSPQTRSAVSGPRVGAWRWTRARVVAMGVVLGLGSAGAAESVEQAAPAPPPSMAFTLVSRQASLVSKRSPTCLRLDPATGLYERVPSEVVFGGDGRCELQLPPGTYRFEVLAYDEERNDLIAIRAHDRTVGAGSYTATLPEAHPVNLRFSVDGSELKPRQMAVRSIADTGEARWVAKDRAEAAPDLFLSADPSVQLQVVGTSERWTVAYWWRGRPASSLDLRLASAALNVCELEAGEGGPKLNAGTGRMRFPDCAAEFPLRANHRFATNRASGYFGYEFEAAGDRLLVAVPARVELARRTRLVVGGALRGRPWTIAAWQDDGKFYPFFEGCLVDAAGREIDLWRSRIKYEAKLLARDGRKIPEEALDDEWREAFDAPSGKLGTELTWSWGGEQVHRGAPDAWVEMKSEHFTLKAPPVWRQKGEHYLALLERSHASWRTHSGWRGPLMVGVGWRRNTHNAKAQVGGDTPWLSIPFKGLREAETPYDMPWFLVHELGHNFGYHHGPEMDAGEAAVNELNDRERWKDVDAFGP